MQSYSAELSEAHNSVLIHDCECSNPHARNNFHVIHLRSQGYRINSKRINQARDVRCRLLQAVLILFSRNQVEVLRNTEVRVVFKQQLMVEKKNKKKKL